jgi:hypothetical protein
MVEWVIIILSVIALVIWLWRFTMPDPPTAAPFTLNKPDPQFWPRHILLNYAYGGFYRNQWQNAQSGLKYGFDRVMCQTQSSLDEDHMKVLSLSPTSRGAGYWTWKPYIILKAVEALESDQDILFYCDSGTYFIRDMGPIFDLIQENGSLVVSIPYKERHWNKRDVLIKLGCDTPAYTESNQICATYSGWRKTPQTLQFLKTWLQYCYQRSMVDDSPSREPNHPGFREYRHDQAIFSLLAKQYRLFTISQKQMSQYISREHLRRAL